MLSRLSISNYALIDHLDLMPGEGLSIVTGETGAGKSIMLGALSLVMGERADLKVIADKEKKAVVEAAFDAIGESLKDKILKSDPEWDGGELIIRREIYPSGRSRAFLNDSPVSLAFLQDISQELLDIHSQNSNTLLSEPQTQLQLLDSIADNEVLLREYTDLFRRYAALRQQIKHNEEEAAKLKEQREMIVFRLGQLDQLKPKAGELKKIEARYETLSNSEEIRSSLIVARNALAESEAASAIDKIESASSALADIDFTIWEENDPEIQDRLRQCVVELKDIVETIEDAVGMTEFNPATLEAYSRRMNDYYQAMRNFKLESDEQLEELHKSLTVKLKSLDSGDAGNEELDRQARAIASSLRKLGKQLSEKRRAAATDLEKEILKESQKLGLNNLRFSIIVKNARLSKSGGDAVEFLAAFNKTGELASVGSIASGGEMARLMLAIKKITASRLNLPTIIFDEIDTGVSGSIADSMGEMMKEMGSVMQILTITHLPQVAVKGTRHFKVYKEDRGDATVSDVMLLDSCQREEEIGRMLSGRELDAAALSNARSLLRGNSK